MGIKLGILFLFFLLLLCNFCMQTMLNLKILLFLRTCSALASSIFMNNEKLKKLLDSP